MLLFYFFAWCLGNIILNASFADIKQGVKLQWEMSESSENIYYKIFQKNVNNEWETISTHEQGKPISVLNIYPSPSNMGVLSSFGEYEIPIVPMQFSDSREHSIYKSASLKVWMEGGSISGVESIPYGANPETNEQTMNITLKSIDEFETAIASDNEWIYQFDVIVFGFWDASGGYSLSTNSCDTVIREYINEGYGFLAGHDTICYIFTRNNGNDEYIPLGLNSIRDMFGVKETYYLDGNSFSEVYTYLMTLTKKGLILQYPWTLDIDFGINYSTKQTHTTSQEAVGDIWFEIPSIASGKNNFYLTTHGNTALIQTGHANCEAEEMEIKLLANTILYLKQRTIDNHFDDHYYAHCNTNPQITNIIIDPNNYLLSFEANDNGIEYDYKVIAYDYNRNAISESNHVNVYVTKGIQKFKYVIDNKMECDETELIYETTNNYIKLKTEHIVNQMYFHIAIIDKSNNAGEIETYKIPSISTKSFTESNTFTKSNTFSNTFTKSNTFTSSKSFTESNTFTISNTFTKSNSCTQSNIFTKSNSFTNSNTFTELYYLRTTYWHSYSLTFSITFMTSFVINNSFITNTRIFTMIDSVQSFFITQIIYYEYTIVIYKSYFEYYSDFFTNIQYQETQTENKSSTVTIVIVIVICIIVIIIIFVLIFLYVIRRHNNNKISDSECESNEEYKHQTEISSNFKNYTANNIDEDPFANDFDEDNHIINI